MLATIRKAVAGAAFAAAAAIGTACLDGQLTVPELVAGAGAGLVAGAGVYLTPRNQPGRHAKG